MKSITISRKILRFLVKSFKILYTNILQHCIGGYEVMQKLKETIKKIGQFTYYFSDMDTVILDKNSAVVWEYGQNQLPEPLQPYIECDSKAI